VFIALAMTAKGVRAEEDKNVLVAHFLLQSLSSTYKQSKPGGFGLSR